jgi:hypothetical protein
MGIFGKTIEKLSMGDAALFGKRGMPEDKCLNYLKIFPIRPGI